MTTQHEITWGSRLTASVAAEVRRRRQLAGMSTQGLADRCAELGVSIPRSVLANLEGGRREAVSVGELLALGAALRVPPLLLAFPLGASTAVEPLPGVDASPWEAISWAIGERSPGPDPSPLAEHYGPGWSLTRLFREHESQVAALFTLHHWVLEQREELAAVRAGVAVGRVPVDLDLDARLALDMEIGDAGRVGHEVAAPSEDELRDTLRVSEARAVRVREGVVQLRRLIREQDATPPASEASALLGPWPDDDDDDAADGGGA